MLQRLVSCLLVTLVLSGVAVAGPVRDLTASMRFEELFAVLRSEGLRFGKELETDLFPGGGGAAWTREVSRIHDADRMREAAVTGLEKSLEPWPEDLAAIQAFMDSETGKRVTALELAARQAYLDDEVKALAERAWGNFGTDLPARVALIEALVETSDLIEQNVAGGMNSNLAFYQGMRTSGGFGEDVPEADMMADLWSQEDAIREETASWLMPYLSMAYRPLSDAELQAYVTFSESAPGQRLNKALFAAFDEVFSSVSRELGEAAGHRLTGSDI